MSRHLELQTLFSNYVIANNAEALKLCANNLWRQRISCFQTYKHKLIFYAFLATTLAGYNTCCLYSHVNYATCLWHYIIQTARYLDHFVCQWEHFNRIIDVVGCSLPLSRVRLPSHDYSNLLTHQQFWPIKVAKIIAGHFSSFTLPLKAPLSFIFCSPNAVWTSKLGSLQIVR